MRPDRTNQIPLRPAANTLIALVVRFAALLVVAVAVLAFVYVR